MSQIQYVMNNFQFTIMKIFVILCVVSASVQGFSFNPNSTDLSKCKVHYSRSGSKYKDFYSLEDIPEQNETLALDFHFAVLAPSDAHILLAPSDSVKADDPAYEIVIGAGGNTFCDIRRKQKSDVKASQRVRGLLSALDPQFFWLHMSKDGDIEVGREGEELPFISWTDPDPLPLKVISFSTWSGVEAKWYFDCERQNLTKEIERPLSGVERLRRDLLFHYDPYVRPVMDHTTITVVMLALQINYIDLNEYKSSIQLLAHSKMAWHDEKLQWNSSDYDDIDILHIYSREIWQPDLLLFNDIGDGRDIVEDSMMIVHSGGLVEWNPTLHMNAWCDVEDLGVWPKDKHKCTLILGMKKEFNFIQLVFIKNESSLVTQRSSKWFVWKADVLSGKFGNNDWDPPMITISLVIQRQSNFYNTIFFTPFLVISVSILLSFWTDPFGHLKLSLVCGQLILTTILLLALGLFAPNHSKHVPHLVTLYSYSLVAILVAIIISIIVINISREKNRKPLPHILCTLLTSGFLKVTFCLPKVNMFDEYGKLSDMSTKSHEKDQQLWIQLGMVIDRLSFFVYLCLTIYVIYSFY